jgi:signal transduction histidine kinase
VLDRAGSVISSNPAAKQILAKVSDNILTEILNKTPSLSVSAADDETLPDAGQTPEAVKIQQPQRYYVGNRVLSALTAPVKTTDGENLGTVIALRDISREAEVERLKDVFIQQISHELRTPLTAVKGYSELLLMSANNSLSEKQYKFMASLDHSAGILMQHVNKIIDISQIQAGALRLEKKDVNLTELVKNGTESWREKLESQRLSLRVTLPPTDLHVCGDSNRLSWALDNLLSNAYNYTMPGGQVEVQLFRTDNQIRIDVTDTGIGMAVDDQPYLFTPFFRATHQSTYEVAGAGLGLYITHSIIEAHGGRAWAQSELNVGSTFSLALPMVQRDINNK